MYAALDENKQLINAIECPQQGSYTCPKCFKPVKLIFNEEKPFFRHQNSRDNDVNERNIHKRGKKLIALSLSELHYDNIQIEPLLSEINQRPDIMVGNSIAIEYQCAKIDVRKLRDRVTSYQKKQIDNYWVLGGDYLSDKLMRQHQKFISYHKNWGFYLIMFDSMSKKITLFYEIRFIGPFNKIVYRCKHFNCRNLQYLLSFKPELSQKKKIKVNQYHLDRIRRMDNPKMNNFKLLFFQKHKIRVESFIQKLDFSPLKPIYKTHHWQIKCGASAKRLNQPLLDMKKR